MRLVVAVTRTVSQKKMQKIMLLDHECDTENPQHHRTQGQLEPLQPAELQRTHRYARSIEKDSVTTAYLAKVALKPTPHSAVDS